MTRSKAKPLCPSVPTPLHDARHVLFYLQRGATSAEQIAERGGLRLATVRKHLETLRTFGLIVDFTPVGEPQEARAQLRSEAENCPAYRESRRRYLNEAIRFGSRGAQVAQSLGAPRMHKRRTATVQRAYERLARLAAGESCAAVFGLAA